MPRRTDRGVTLLEVMVAVSILAVAGTVGLRAGSEALWALQSANEREIEFREASSLMTAISLWPADELALRLGDRPQGQYRVNIGRPAGALYSVVLSDSAGTVLLETVLYRPSDPGVDR